MASPAAGPCWRKPRIGPIGMTICYDLRFPHLYRALAQAGAKLFTIPSAFTVPTGEAHWHVLLRRAPSKRKLRARRRARRAARGFGRETYGHSLVVSPWGEILAEAGSEPCVVMAEVDPAAADLARARIPSLRAADPAIFLNPAPALLPQSHDPL